MTNIVRLERSIDTCIEMLTERLTECAEAKESVDLATWVQWYAFDVIGKLFFSRTFGFIQHAHDHAGYIRALDLLLPMIAVACVMQHTCARYFFLAERLYRVSSEPSELLSILRMHLKRASPSDSNYTVSRP